MKRSLAVIVLSAVIVAGYGCKKKPLSRTSQIKSGRYVWMGSVVATGSPPCYDAFTEFDVTIVDDQTLVVFRDTLRYLSTDPASREIVFSHDDNPGYYHINKETLYFNPTNRTMRYRADHNGSYGGVSEELSNASYRRFADMSPRVSIQGVRNLSGTQSDKIGIPSQQVDTTYDITKSITFNPLTDSTLSVSGQVLNLGDSILYYKSIDPASHVVVWQTHHTATVVSTLTFNYETNQMTFEQLDHVQWSRRYVRLQ